MTWRRGYGIIGGARPWAWLDCFSSWNALSDVGQCSNGHSLVANGVKANLRRLSDLAKKSYTASMFRTMNPTHPEDVSSPWYYSKYCPGDAQTLFFFDSNCYEDSVQHRRLCLPITESATWHKGINYHLPWV
jgi:hypothetical protein